MHYTECEYYLQKDCCSKLEGRKNLSLPERQCRLCIQRQKLLEIGNVIASEWNATCFEYEINDDWQEVAGRTRPGCRGVGKGI